ncbi:MAG TPA: hypothetical protein VKT28_03505 [Puia sp.]|nr:hypothetical protein [Puia sp.]
MLENLLDLIKQHAGEAITNNPAIPNSQNDAAVAEAGNSIVNGLKDMISQGKVQDVLSLLQGHGGNVASNPTVQNISGNFVQSLMDKFGLGQGQANGIASSIIPNVIQSLIHKTNDPNDNSFSIEGILSHLTGGQQGGLEGLLGNLTQGGAGGIMDKIKGLFGNA